MTDVLTDPSPNALVAAVEAHQRELSARWTLVQGGFVEDRPELLRYVTGLRVSFTNGAHAARLRPEDVDHEIEATVDLFRSRGIPGIWWVGPLSEPPELGEALEAHGFRMEEELPWMAADLAAVPDAPVADGLVPERVTGDAMQVEWLAAMTAGFGMTDEVRDAMARLAEPVGYGPDARWIRYRGSVDGRPVATAGLMLGGGVAGIYNVTTVPDARRRGYGAAMTAAALADAREMGYRVAVLGSSDMGRGVYERLGFREVCRMRLYEWSPPARAPGSG